MSTPITFSKHARQVMRARGVSTAEVRDVVRNYAIRTVSTSYRGEHRPDVYMYKNGTLAVVAHETGQHVHIITVLLNRSDQWTDADARARHHTSSPAS